MFYSFHQQKKAVGSPKHTLSLLTLLFPLYLFQLVAKLEEKCNLLQESHKQALVASPDDIMYTTPSDVGIYYDDDGRHQQQISQQLKSNEQQLVSSNNMGLFWYL